MSSMDAPRDFGASGPLQDFRDNDHTLAAQKRGVSQNKRRFFFKFASKSEAILSFQEVRIPCQPVVDRKKMHVWKQLWYYNRINSYCLMFSLHLGHRQTWGVEPQGLLIFGVYTPPLCDVKVMSFDFNHFVPRCVNVGDSLALTVRSETGRPAHSRAQATGEKKIEKKSFRHILGHSVRFPSTTKAFQNHWEKWLKVTKTFGDGCRYWHSPDQSRRVCAIERNSCRVMWVIWGQFWDERPFASLTCGWYPGAQLIPYCRVFCSHHLASILFLRPTKPTWAFNANMHPLIRMI